jgi:outer membrane lipoprotein-sorting protein
MRRLLCLTLGLWMVLPALAQDSKPKEEESQGKPAAKGDELKDPVEILRRADAATKDVKAVRYKGRVELDGVAKSRLPKVEGEVLLAGNGEDLERFRVEMRGEMPGGGKKINVIAGSDGNEFYVLDKETKKAYIDIDPGVMGPYAPVQSAAVLFSVVMREFTHPRPFSDEINGDKQELKGTEKVGSEECYKIYVEYSGGLGKSNWYFSRKDFLPRRVDRLISGSQGEGSYSTIVLDLEVDPKLKDDAFKPEAPEGYEKTDEPIKP